MGWNNKLEKQALEKRYDKKCTLLLMIFNLYIEAINETKEQSL